MRRMLVRRGVRRHHRRAGQINLGIRLAHAALEVPVGSREHVLPVSWDAWILCSETAMGLTLIAHPSFVVTSTTASVLVLFLRVSLLT